ncbi:MAG: DnaJ domain-containing protein [Syntrophales bacterium]|nr:DnaJ domain-containing protein [Syntrophales bacterium]
MKAEWQIEWRDYYKVLQVIPEAEREVIEGAYKRLAAKYHPDNRETGDQDKFLLIHEAHDVLANPRLRKEYDAAYREHDRAEAVASQDKYPFRQVFCSNGICRGLINEDGICLECRKAYIQEAHRDLSRKSGKPIVDEDV